jgi:hypothetical protein
VWRRAAWAAVIALAGIIAFFAEEGASFPFIIDLYPKSISCTTRGGSEDISIGHFTKNVENTGPLLKDRSDELIPLTVANEHSLHDVLCWSKVRKIWCLVKGKIALSARWHEAEAGYMIDSMGWSLSVVFNPYPDIWSPLRIRIIYIQEADIHNMDISPQLALGSLPREFKGLASFLGLPNSGTYSHSELLFAREIQADRGDAQSDSGERQNAGKDHKPARVVRERFVGFFFFGLGCFGGGMLFLLGSYAVFRHIASVYAEEEARAKRKAHQGSIQRPNDPPTPHQNGPALNLLQHYLLEF